MIGWRRIPASEVSRIQREAVSSETLQRAAVIVDSVRTHGMTALVEHAVRFGDRQPGEPVVIHREELVRAADALPKQDRALLERTASRIRTFADAQRECLRDLEVAVPGGAAGHRITPVARAGCYAPGGRFPLPSSILMTAVVANAAGVDEVWAASPKPQPIVLAAAAIAGVDALVAAGGAHAIAALAYGAGEIPPCNVVAGPGNRWVTAAKQLVSGQVGIDMLAGPSELVVIADAKSDPALIAADLLAQAEHDPDALPILITLDERLIESVEAEIVGQLAMLPTSETAAASIRNGFAVVAGSIEEALQASDQLAPEHLELMFEGAAEHSSNARCYGGLFVGASSAEVLGDYGAGPNHVLPTGGSARHAGGLSVATFLTMRTWMRIDDRAGARELMDDAVRLARLEGLEGHARAAERRKQGTRN